MLVHVRSEAYCVLVDDQLNSIFAATYRTPGRSNVRNVPRKMADCFISVRAHSCMYCPVVEQGLFNNMLQITM